MAIADIRRLTAAAAGVAVVLELALGCVSKVPAAAAPVAPPPAAEIYAAVIGRHFQPQAGRKFYIESTLQTLDRIRIHAIEHPLWPALLEASSHPQSLPDALPAPLPYELLSEAQLEAARVDPAVRDSLSGTDGYELVSFSAIGFDPDGRRALVYVEWHCGAECGGGGYYELERQGAVWRTANYIHRFDI